MVKTCTIRVRVSKTELVTPSPYSALTMKHFKCVVLTIAVTGGNTQYHATEINAVTDKSQLLYIVFMNAVT